MSITINESIERLRAMSVYISKETIYNYIKKGSISAKKVEKEGVNVGCKTHWAIDIDSLERWAVARYGVEL